MKIGIIGNGNIASYLLQMINVEKRVKGEVVAVLGRSLFNKEKVEKSFRATFFTDFESFINSSIDIVIEAATIQAVQELANKTLKNNKDIIISSVGAFKESEFTNKLTKTALNNNKQIYIPSGAIGGLDIIQSANSLGGLKEVTLTTVKSPESLGKNNVNKEEVIFEGAAQEAIEKYPKNVNVALILSLAGLGANSTRITIKVNPETNKNMHIINAYGSFGEMELKVQNNSMPNNPKTSYLAALSIIYTLNKTNKTIKIG